MDRAARAVAQARTVRATRVGVVAEEVDVYPGITPDRCVIFTSQLLPDTTVVKCARKDHDGRVCRTVGIGLYDDRSQRTEESASDPPK